MFKAGLPYAAKVLKAMLKYVSPRWLIQNPVDNEDKLKQGLLLLSDTNLITFPKPHLQMLAHPG